MDFANEIFGATSCNVDGSMDVNPLMSFADQVFNFDSVVSSDHNFENMTR